jgi:Tfp pilus assembly protein FimT
MNRISKNRCQGITLIEILMILGVLIVIVSFAAPSVSGATARADMRAASENLHYSIRIARNTARMDESIVTMNLVEGGDEAGYRITFSESESAAGSSEKMASEQMAPEQPGLQDYQFNKEIKVVSDFPSFEFDSRGIVKKPGQITLISMTDDSVTTQIMVK